MAKQKKEAEPIPFDELFVNYRAKVDGFTSSKAKNLTILGIIVAGVLIAASSVLYSLEILNSWIPALIGAPAGVLLFLIGLGVIYRTKVGEWNIFSMRERLSFRQRVRRILIWLGVYAVVFIPLGSYIPYGVGGAILISLALTCLAVARRSPQEIEWAKNGFPDPRDIAEAEEKDEYVQPTEGALEETIESEADTVYYDEQRGGIGGKLN